MPVKYEDSGMVRLPEELSRKFRDHVRKTEGEAVANAPFAMLMRYVAARAAGMSRDEAAKYLFRINHKDN